MRRYELSEDEDQLGTGVGCVVRSSPESTPLDKNQLQCTAVDRIRCRYPVGENEEIVSTMVCLKPYNGVDMDFQVYKSCEFLDILTLADKR